MSTGLQQRYCEEVLGLTLPNNYGAASELATVAVECEPLTEATRALLDKILATVHLKDCPQFDIGSDAIPSVHRLRFAGLGGRTEESGTVHWHLPRLSEMTGAGPEVTELKKSAWNLLRQFMQEDRS